MKVLLSVLLIAFVARGEGERNMPSSYNMIRTEHHKI